MQCTVNVCRYFCGCGRLQNWKFHWSFVFIVVSPTSLVTVIICVGNALPLFLRVWDTIAIQKVCSVLELNSSGNFRYFVSIQRGCPVCICGFRVHNEGGGETFLSYAETLIQGEKQARKGLPKNARLIALFIEAFWYPIKKFKKLLLRLTFIVAARTSSCLNRAREDEKGQNERQTWCETH